MVFFVGLGLFDHAPGSKIEKEALFRCHLPPPTPEECTKMPTCNDAIEAEESNEICTALEMHSSCAGGFTFYDPSRNHHPPFSLYTDKQRRSKTVVSCVWC